MLAASDAESIDRTWMITLQSDIGPCGMMDRMGLGVVYHVATLIGEGTPGHPALASARYIDEEFIQRGHLGVASGQGFYSYPHPAFAQLGLHLNCPRRHVGAAVRSETAARPSSRASKAAARWVSS